MTEPAATSPLHEGFTPWTAAWRLDGATEIEEALSAWTCACDAWTAYWRRVATCASPLELYDAGAQLMTDGLEIYSRAAAARLKGLAAPLLADA